MAVLAAVSLALAGLSLGSCTEENELLAPTETWVEKNYTYKSDDGTQTQLTCYFMFTKTGYTNSQLQNVVESSKNGSATSIKPGMTVVLMPAAGSTGGFLGTLTEKQFVMKTFPLGQQTVGDDGSESSGGASLNMTENKWNVFYYANIVEFTKNDQLKNPPTPLKTAGWRVPTDLSKFSWKKMLAEYLLQGIE